jgi:L-arabinokinase
MLAVYVSGHGFGHATRTAEVLRVVRERAPGLAITVCTAAPRALFADAVRPPLAVREVQCDVGLVQRDALTIEEAASAEAVARFISGWPALLQREVSWLRQSGARLVVGDIPPLAFAAASQAGLPSIGLANFSWDWIYRHLGRRRPSLLDAAQHAADAYGQAGLLLRLPLAGDLSAFPRIEDVPLVCRRPAVPKTQARLRLGLDLRPTVLLSFGGLGLPGLAPASLAQLGEYQFLLTGGVVTAGAAPNVRSIPNEALAAVGLEYVDLVGAVDVVVSKPGYGIVTDCIGSRTRLVYTDRGDFPEYDVLVAGMPRYLPVAFVPSGSLRAGRLGEALAAVRPLEFPESPRMDGAGVAASRVLAAMRAG